MKGAVHGDRLRRGIYATDASIYEIRPVAVAVPRDEEDVIAALAAAAEHAVSVIPRGAGTSLGGQVTGPSLVLDFTKHMNRVLEVDPAGGWARVQPGLVRDDLNAGLAPHGLFYAPDPATSDRATLGGILGNNSSGMRSVRYGKAVDHVLAMKIALAGGSVLALEELSPAEYGRRAAGGGDEGRILGGFRGIVESRREEIVRRFPKVMRRVAGYNLDEFTATDRWNLSKLIAGSEGTLATLLEAKVNLERKPAATALSVPHYRTLDEALRAIPGILLHGPTAVEVLDRSVVAQAVSNPATAPISDFIEGEPDGILIVEFSGENEEETRERARRFAEEAVERGRAYACPIRLGAAEQARVWEVRRAGLGLVMAIPGARKGVPFIEDACVPVERLAEYVRRILEICREHGTGASLYGHGSVGVLHIRPALDLHDPEDVGRMGAIAREAFELVREFGGSWSGEHGDGLVRSAYLEEFFGPEVYAAFREVKTLFDPAGIMNPGKIVGAPRPDENLRYGPHYRPVVPPTRFHYRSSGGFLAAVEMCNGVGACRKRLTGTMCPSYIATRDEEHSTRGRANALRQAITGGLGPGGLTAEGLDEVLDLCLSCKACKAECPSNVDMARLKSEQLQARWDREGAPLRERIVALSPRAASIAAGLAAPLVNAVQRSALFRGILEKAAGFDRRRVPPPYARESFPRLFSKRKGSKGGPPVVLFDDTYMNFHEPRVGVAATELLESCGYSVILARAGCCQRPRISHGFLREAAQEGETTLRNLDRFVRKGMPVVVCEPGCASALADDLPDLMDDEELAARVSRGVFPIDGFLDREIREGRLESKFVSPEARIVIHGHCHQKALGGTSAMKRILSAAPGLAVEEIDSGCCGMAGSFGYEKEHYDLSMTVGEDRLFPALRALPEEARIVACGFSCRHQIADATGRRAIHFVEVIRGEIGRRFGGPASGGMGA
ncbi:MAG: FAD-linked oxidase C-terminal domain-containing protein [Candidatus Eisenbacteria bacterium]